MSILIKPVYAVLAILLLCSCSPRHTENNALPNYEMMQAAEDAGRTPDSSPAETKTGGVK